MHMQTEMGYNRLSVDIFAISREPDLMKFSLFIVIIQNLDGLSVRTA